MEHLDFFKQLFGIALGVFAALVLAFYIIWPKIENYLLKLNSINQSKLLTKENLQLRYAAYERLLLLVHRLSPAQVMSRTHDPNWTVSQFRKAVIADLENEFQHNLTQQLYVSDAAWTVIKDLKANTIVLLRNASQGLGEAALDQYITTVLKHVSELDINPYEAAQVLLKNELAS